jgi:phage-related protein (TIGR01555 family)
MATTSYGFQLLDDLQIFNIYRSNWLGRKMVEIPAMDAVRKGRDWQAQQDQIELIEAEENRLGFWVKLLEAKIKARLWGGAAIYIGTGDANLMEPLDPGRVGRGGIKYLTVLTRRDVMAGEISQDATSPFYGKPAYYQITGETAMVKIHPSRFAIFVGAPHSDPYLAISDTRGWGDSILESVYSAMKNADATAANIASLVFEANVDVFRIPDFMSGLAATAKGINKSLILDKEEEYERKQVTFATLPDVMQSFLQMAAGAADIPVTRLLGQSPAGMSATGDGDMNNYYDRVSSIQGLEMTPALYLLDECLIRSALGSRPPEIFFSWSPLKQMTEKELAEIGKMNAETAQLLQTSGLFMAQELRDVVSNQFVESGFYPGLDQVVSDTDAAGKFDLGQEADQEQTQPQQTADAAPRSLYVSRKVTNAAEIIAWAKGQGFATTLPTTDLHVTVMYSPTAVDWMQAGQDSWNADGTLIIPPGGPRVVSQFGQGAIVLEFSSAALSWRHEELKRIGAEPTYPEYAPHITITYEPGDVDVDKVEPYRGKINLGIEIFAELTPDWAEGVTEE